MFLPFSFFKLNYFGVGPYHIAVKNHNIFWRHRKYYFDEIAEVVMDSVGNESNSITFLFNNGKKKRIQGSSLRNNNWIALKKTLEQRGVRVIDKKDFEKLETPQVKKNFKLLYILLSM